VDDDEQGRRTLVRCIDDPACLADSVRVWARARARRLAAEAAAAEADKAETDEDGQP
jgi:hypothetical protein